GRLIITVPSKISKPILEFMAYNLKIIDRIEIEDHKKYYNKKDIIESAKLSNFIVEKHKYFQFGCNNFAILKKQ
ncbi:class I SAM-dependent methyltransferase, partial [Brachyspira pilosicoli]